MSELGDYLKQNYNQGFFIEVEGRVSVISRFMDEYNEHKQLSGIPADGIVRLSEEKDKRGIEYRVYLKHVNNIPAGIEPITKNKVYRKEYPFRISKREYVRPLLFEDGFHLGLN